MKAYTSTHCITCTVAVCFGMMAGQQASAQDLLGPTPYLSELDSPLSGLPGFALETFEDDTLDLPGVTSSTASIVQPGPITDSVDGDDGVIDGDGRGGHTWFFGNGGAGITFTFNAQVIGFVPRSVGVVWTDGAGTVTFEAFDTAGNSLGTLSGSHPDGAITGTTSEDRFYGVSHASGIGSIRIRNTSGGIEVDHLQYADGVVVGACSPADLNADGLLNNTDVNLFVSAFLNMQPAADLNGDTLFNNTDINLFVQLFLNGCP